MASYLIRAKKMFRDNPAKKTRKKNDEFFVDQERLDALQKASDSLVEVIKSVEQNDESKSDAADKKEEDHSDVEVEEVETNEKEERDEAEVVEESSEKELENEEVVEVKAKKPESETKYPLHVGGPYFLLSNGEKVKGKDEAEKAEKEL